MLQNHRDYCPYCGEIIELVIDLSLAEQEYIEDCNVCCRPIVVSLFVDIESEAFENSIVNIELRSDCE